MERWNESVQKRMRSVKDWERNEKGNKSEEERLTAKQRRKVSEGIGKWEGSEEE